MKRYQRQPDGWGPAQVSSHAPAWANQEWSTTGADTYNPRHYLDARSIARLRHPVNHITTVSTYVPAPVPQARWDRSPEEIVKESFDLGFGGWSSLGTRGTP